MVQKLNSSSWPPGPRQTHALLMFSVWLIRGSEGVAVVNTFTHTHRIGSRRYETPWFGAQKNMPQKHRVSYGERVGADQKDVGAHRFLSAVGVKAWV